MQQLLGNNKKSPFSMAKSVIFLFTHIFFIYQHSARQLHRNMPADYYQSYL